MEEIYDNDEHGDSKSSENQRGPSSSERRFHGAAVLFLLLLSVFLLARLISLDVHHGNLTERLRASESRVSSLTEELDRLQTLSKQKKSCPAGWMMFSYVCYLLSDEFGSWDKGRKDCTDRGADLVVIESSEEQKFLSGFTKNDTWIGLSDRDEEGTWKWIDGTPLTLNSWRVDQPDNGGEDPWLGEEDCAHIKAYSTKLNDLSCAASIHWICEKIA